MDKDMEVIAVPDCFRYVQFDTDKQESTGLAGQANNPFKMEILFTTDCRDTSTLTVSLLNMTNVTPKVTAITIPLAMICGSYCATANGTRYQRACTTQMVIFGR
jgi:hypothetical protein